MALMALGQPLNRGSDDLLLRLRQGGGQWGISSAQDTPT